MPRVPRFRPMPWGVEFPGAELARSSARLRGGRELRRQARLGMRGASFRWVGVEVNAARLEAAWRANPDPRHGIDVMEDVDRFGFFTNAVAVIDSLAYSAYALGAIRHRRSFPMQTEADMRNVTLKATAERFAALDARHPLTRALTRAAVSPALRGILVARNVMMHRATDQLTLAINRSGIRRQWTLTDRRTGYDAVDLTPAYLRAIEQVISGHAMRIGCGLDAYTEEHFIPPG